MGLPLFLRVFILSAALSLLAYAFIGEMTLVELAKLLALSLALTLLIPLTYPHIRGVRRGDALSIINAPHRLPIPIPFLQTNPVVIALESGRIGSKVRVSMPDGSARSAEIVSYAGFLQPANARIVENEVSNFASFKIM